MQDKEGKYNVNGREIAHFVPDENESFNDLLEKEFAQPKVDRLGENLLVDVVPIAQTKVREEFCHFDDNEDILII
jgi:hypothetical protein